MASRIVLLDTNALLMPFQFRVNLETELTRLMGSADIAIPRPVRIELELLAERDRNVQAALRLAARYRVIEASGSYVDALHDLGASHRAVVGTNDHPLLDRLRAVTSARIFPRSRYHMVSEGLLQRSTAY